MKKSKRISTWLLSPLGMLGLTLLVGCGAGISHSPSALSVHLQGSVRGGQQPISGSTIQLYAVGTTGNGSAATPLISQTVLTDSAGSFDLTGLYTCPSSDSVLYLVAQGGNPGLAPGTNNPAIGLLSVLGTCGALQDSNTVAINEATTIASIWPLAPYAQSATQIGFANTAAYQPVAKTINSLVNIEQGTAPGPLLGASDDPLVAKLYSLADILSHCVDSSGGAAGDGSACGRLFSATSFESAPVPTNTISAALNVAQNPFRNVFDIYYLLPLQAPFLPTLKSAPDDWMLQADATTVSVAITPGSVTLTPSHTQQFSASITGSTNQAVTWSLSSALGTVSATGLYTAPASVISSQSVTLTATSVADTTKLTRVIVSLNPAVSITMTPGNTTAVASQTRQFGASVAGSTNKAVTWSLSSALGTVSATGLYTAPASIPSAQTVTVTATSVADATKSVSAIVSLIPPIVVSMTPGSAALQSSQTRQFSASVTGTTNTAVTWRLSPSVGTISASGLYTAPATLTTPQAVMVTATSVVDLTKIATATISLSNPVSVALAPGGITLTPSQTQQFSALITGSTNKAVTWSLSSPLGVISASGLYTAPASVISSQSVTLTATSVADTTKLARVNISLIPPVSISITPGSTTALASQTRQFSASIAGSTNKAVTWSMSPALGTISATGLYTAPTVNVGTQPAAVTVTATSVADATKTASATVWLTPSVSVSMTQELVTLQSSQTQLFTASVTGTSNPAVTWSLSPAVGTISASGLYIAPNSIATPQTITVTATSVADATKSANASLSLIPVERVVPAAGSVALLPSFNTLMPSQTQQLTASIEGNTSGAVTWTLNPAVGTISASGLYTAPATITTPQTVTVTATSIGDATKTMNATIALFSAPPTLRQIGALKGILIGAAADADEYGQQSPLTHNPAYASTLSTQYSMLEGENAMKWGVIGAQQGPYNFEPGDALVTFAQANGMQVRGHNLCWNQQNPDWLATQSSSQLSQILHDYIFTTMQHYKGQIFAWDVVNEAIANNATGVGTNLNDSVWYNQPGIGLSGTGYIEQAFRWAREADPTAKLFYNDHDIEYVGGKSQALINMLKDFIQRGVPIDGVGLEMHIDTTVNYPATFPAALKAYTDLGLEVHITEMDVRLPINATGQASAADLQAQANAYSFIVKTCLQNPHCTAIQTWGFGDKWSWVTRAFPGMGAALPFDMNYQPKPAYDSILNALETTTY